MIRQDVFHSMKPAIWAGLALILCALLLRAWDTELIYQNQSQPLQEAPVADHTIPLLHPNLGRTDK